MNEELLALVKEFAELRNKSNLEAIRKYPPYGFMFSFFFAKEKRLALRIIDSTDKATLGDYTWYIEGDNIVETKEGIDNPKISLLGFLPLSALVIIELDTIKNMLENKESLIKSPILGYNPYFSKMKIRWYKNG